MGLLDQLRRVKRFLFRDLWEVDISDLPRAKALLVRQVQVANLVVRDFIADRCLLRASALTYATLLSIVPLLALMFAVLKGFGVQNSLQPLLLEKFAAGSGEVIGEIVNYIDNTNVGRLGMLGLAMLIFTVLTLLSNIEKSFNAIWGVDETRGLLRRFADYFSVVTVGPLLVIAAISMTSTLQSHAFVARFQATAFIGPIILFLFSTIPYLGMWIAFTALYIFMPNTKVNYRAAVVGGIFGGTLWQLAQLGYVHFQVGVAKYNAIYGTMAALPIFMVWIYLSWLIVLLGLEVTYAWQNLRLVPSDVRGEQVNFSSREMVALTVMLVVGEAFYRGEKRWTPERLCVDLDLPPRLAKNILAQLVRLGFLSEVHDNGDEGCHYQPGLAPEVLTVHDLLEGLKGDGVTFARLRRTPERDVVTEIEARIAEAGRSALQGATLQDLVTRMRERRGEEGEEGEG
ncbi:YihY/virulence factor BrkB family protein [uncultured Desulfuromonas sp.]|uniref:YihY/virulence factor BrkB family protein n=1 Tax=uncultured Desulfuromonas sp. TaxID=181013 RepID=UPI0026019F54|nr:YihY/virulence factor BrkB family protein [uncultured Desulfuromonas sp.]